MRPLIEADEFKKFREVILNFPRTRNYSHLSEESLVPPEGARFDSQDVQFDFKKVVSNFRMSNMALKASCVT